VASGYQALRQYEQLRESLRREFGTGPSAISSRLHEDIVAGRFPVAQSPLSDYTLSEKVADLPRHNVPAALSSFVGRERERVEVERALAMTRLLTLTGVGGCGKTRLALEVSRDVAGTYRDGAWLAELAPLSNPELLPQAVAAGLGLRERLEKSQQPFIPSLIDALLSKELLLVLDNCEHLADAVPTLLRRSSVLVWVCGYWPLAGRRWASWAKRPGQCHHCPCRTRAAQARPRK